MIKFNTADLSNTNSLNTEQTAALSAAELDAIVGGTNWGNVFRTVNKVSSGVVAAMNPGSLYAVALGGNPILDFAM